MIPTLAAPLPQVLDDPRVIETYLGAARPAST